VPQPAKDIVFARKIMPVILEATKSPFGSAAPIMGAAGTTMFISVLPPGTGPCLHSHNDTHETFFVLDGAIEYQIGDPVTHRVTLNKWDTLSCPPRIYRGFRNLSDYLTLISWKPWEDLRLNPVNLVGNYLIEPKANGVTVRRKCNTTIVFVSVVEDFDSVDCWYFNQQKFGQRNLWPSSRPCWEPLPRASSANGWSAFQCLDISARNRNRTGRQRIGCAACSSRWGRPRKLRIAFPIACESAPQIEAAATAASTF